jgi:hypothetical protein
VWAIGQEAADKVAVFRNELQSYDTLQTTVGTIGKILQIIVMFLILFGVFYGIIPAASKC